MCTIVDDALNLRLIMHVLHEFNASTVSHNRCPLLLSLVTPVKILHIKMMDHVIINKMFNECDVLTIFCWGKLTQSLAFTHSALFSKALPLRSN